MSVSARLNRRGATLPLTILLLSLMGVAVAIGYSRVASERRTTGDGRAQLGAFAVAQSGLNRYLSIVSDKPGWNTTVTYNDLPGGTAVVDVRQVRESTVVLVPVTTFLPAIYAITSRGTYTGAKRFDAITPPAERTVATYALWTAAPFDINGAFTSLSGIHKQGTVGTFSGVDGCAAQATIPGVAVPDAGYTSNPAGNFTAIVGNPNGAPSYLGTGGAGGGADQAVDIDWAGIVAGTYLPPDYVYPSWPTGAEFANWPVVKVNNSGGATFSLPGSNGKGILIVTGDLDLNGSVQWDGLVLVGGTVTSNGLNQVYGAVVSGLNVKLGMAVPPTSVSNGTKFFQYDSCKLARALSSVGSLQRVRNGWIDNWSSY